MVCIKNFQKNNDIFTLKINGFPTLKIKLVSAHPRYGQGKLYEANKFSLENDNKSKKLVNPLVTWNIIGENKTKMIYFNFTSLDASLMTSLGMKISPNGVIEKDRIYKPDPDKSCNSNDKLVTVYLADKSGKTIIFPYERPPELDSNLFGGNPKLKRKKRISTRGGIGTIPSTCNNASVNNCIRSIVDDFQNRYPNVKKVCISDENGKTSCYNINDLAKKECLTDNCSPELNI